MFVALGKELELYDFPDHPFNKNRYLAFCEVLKEKNLLGKFKIVEPRTSSLSELLLFHTNEYIEFVKRESERKEVKVKMYLDLGDTPSFPGVFEAASYVVGTALDCADKTLEGNKVFTPVGGLHHAFPNRASGFCVFNDIAIVIKHLRKNGIEKILYFDIDAHHGDGVFYSFIADSGLFIVDFHEKGNFPGTGSEDEIGEGKAKGTKLNIQLNPYSTDKDFFSKFDKAKNFVEMAKPEFIILQAGADCLANDPITTLQLTQAVHKEVTKFLIGVTDKYARGRMLVFGGGGYNLENVKKGWISVVEEMTKTA